MGGFVLYFYGGNNQVSACRIVKWCIGQSAIQLDPAKSRGFKALDKNFPGNWIELCPHDRLLPLTLWSAFERKDIKLNMAIRQEIIEPYIDLFPIHV